MNKIRHNPDVLSCLANLSNDEVFTPPKLANEILDLLPKTLWQDPKARFLDPFSKTGVFLREISARLMTGLADVIPDVQKRANHILKNQVFGIAITELTALMSRRSLYGSKTADGKYSMCEDFRNQDGNILYERLDHTWDASGKRCLICGATQAVYDRNDSSETYAYQFIHDDTFVEKNKMKFDVVIGNPPYQLNDGGYGVSARPIYQHFVNQAKKLNPRYLTMIIPSRWFSGGKGLDNFRLSMLKDRHIRKLVDYEHFKDVFQGVDIPGGVCYFLWDRDSLGLCEVTNIKKDGTNTLERYLDEFDVFIRQNLALDIIRKVTSTRGKNLSDRVSARKPFGLPTNYEPQKSGIPCWFIQKIGCQFAKLSDIDDSKGYLAKWKLLVPKAPIAGQTDFSKSVGFYYDGNTRIAKPGECCTESWIIAGAFSTIEETLSYKSYLFTKVVRFLLLQTVVSQDVTKKNFIFVPDLEHYKGEYTDKQLCEMWNITDDEWKYIDSRISAIE